eukprot:29440-Eustigmatos_ZCMA.PRE.1
MLAADSRARLGVKLRCNRIHVATTPFAGSLSFAAFMKPQATDNGGPRGLQWLAARTKTKSLQDTGE